jgi:RNA polymerase sigma-70 factor (ECF subfamily)
MNMSIPSEAELLHLAQRLDSIALAQIYDCYSPYIYRYAVRLLGDPSLAEDCVSETFSRLLKALAAGKGPHEFLRAYLYRIAHNWITDQYRHKRPTEEISEILPSEANSLEETMEQNSQCTHLLNAIRELTPDQQQVIVLKFWQDCDNEEIAQALRKPVGAIKSLQHRAMNTLQRHLQEIDQHEAR